MINDLDTFNAHVYANTETAPWMLQIVAYTQNSVLIISKQMKWHPKDPLLILHGQLMQVRDDICWR